VSLNLKNPIFGFATSIGIVASLMIGAAPASADEAPVVAAPSSEVVAAAEAPAAEAVKIEAPAPAAAPVVEAPKAEPAKVVEEATPAAPPAAKETSPAPAVEPVVVAPSPSASTAPVAPTTESSPAPAVETTTEPVTPPTTDTPAPAEECVPADKVSWSYTYAKATGSGTITASSADKAQGTPLCDPLTIRSATWKYVLPASGNPSYPQKLIGFNDTLIGVVGTVGYGSPLEASCRQYDSYAQFQSKEGPGGLPLPAVLNGPGNPYEPPFLHQTLAGKGPNPTYSSTSSDGCNTPPVVTPPVTPPVVTPPVTPPTEPPTGVQEKVVVTLTDNEKFECGDTKVNQTQTTTTTPYTLEWIDGQLMPVEDLKNVTVVTTQTTRDLTPEEIESCKPATPEPTIVKSEWINGMWVCGDTTVTQTRIVTTTIFTPKLVNGSTWELVQSPPVISPETRTVPLTKEQLEVCVAIIVPPTPTTPVIVTTPNHPVAPVVVATNKHPKAVASANTDNDSLAYTGSDSSTGLYMGLGAMVLGLGLAWVARRRRKA